MASVDAKIRTLEQEHKSTRNNIIALWVFVALSFLFSAVFIVLYNKFWNSPRSPRHRQEVLTVSSGA